MKAHGLLKDDNSRVPLSEMRAHPPDHHRAAKWKPKSLASGFGSTKFHECASNKTSSRVKSMLLTD